jgi:fimbrial chaperone protein
VLAAFLVSSTSSVLAAVVAVSPVRIHLSDGKRSELLTLTNNGTEPARFQIKAHEWRQGADGEMILKPSNDLVFFPSLFEIAPGKGRRVRIATTRSPGKSEDAYRIIVTELPRNDGQAGFVRVLTKLNLPVFVQPTIARAKPTLKTTLKGNHVSVVLENRGNSHLKSTLVRVVGRSESGQILFDESWPGWYVLAHGRRSYSVLVSPDVCGELRSVTAVVRTEQDAARSTTEVVPSADCSG